MNGIRKLAGSTEAWFKRRSLRRRSCRSGSVYRVTDKDCSRLMPGVADRFPHFRGQALHLSVPLPAPALPPDDSAARARPQRAGTGAAPHRGGRQRQLTGKETSLLLREHPAGTAYTRRRTVFVPGFRRPWQNDHKRTEGECLPKEIRWVGWVFVPLDKRGKLFVPNG